MYIYILLLLRQICIQPNNFPEFTKTATAEEYIPDAPGDNAVLATRKISCCPRQLMTPSWLVYCTVKQPTEITERNHREQPQNA